MNNKNRKSISLTDTAKLIRETLKVEFPDVKFSVRSKSYSGGSSIDIRWTDGPTSKQVATFTGMFEGASFDGMIDLKSYRSITNEDGEEIHYSVDFIFEHRECSRELTMEVAKIAAHFYGMEVPVMNEHGWFDYGTAPYPVEAHTHENLHNIISQWQQYAVWVDGGIKFLAVGDQWLPGILEHINENPSITLSPTSYHPRRIEFEAEALRKAAELKPIVDENIAAWDALHEASEAAQVESEAEPVAQVEQGIETESAIIARLKAVDLGNMTPLAALNLIAELKSIAGGS